MGADIHGAAKRDTADAEYLLLGADLYRHGLGCFGVAGMVNVRPFANYILSEFS